MSILTEFEAKPSSVVKYQLSNPNWIDLGRIQLLATKVSQNPETKVEDLQRELHTVWQLDSRALFKSLVLREALDAGFFASLRKRDAPEHGVVCLELLYAAAYGGADMATVCAALGEAADALALGSKEYPDMWSTLERNRKFTGLLNSPVVKALKQDLDLSRRNAAQALQQERLTAKALVTATHTSHATELKAQSLVSWNTWLEENNVTAISFSAEKYDALLASPVAKEFNQAFGYSVTPTGLKRAMALDPVQHQLLQAYNATLERSSRERKEAKIEWERSLVPAANVLSTLKLSKSEFSILVSQGKIKPAMEKPGRAGVVELFDISALAATLSHAELTSWRQEQVQSQGFPDWRARALAPQKSNGKISLDTVIKATCAHFGCVMAYRDMETLKFSKLVTERLSFKYGSQRYDYSSSFRLISAISLPRSEAQIESLPTAVGYAWDSTSVGKSCSILVDSIIDLFDSYRADLTDEQFEELTEGVGDALAKGVVLEDPKPGLTVRTWLPRSHSAILARVDAFRAQNLLQLEDYPQSLGVARSIGRRLHAKLGPTNSGKTYEALQSLAAASSGVYLAPLRLLAMEVRDRLMDEGVLCNLLTGEEHDMIPGARHTACTIEMFNPTERVEVAIIDEIQMLEDSNRGWAWTAALIGVPAKEVFLCGSVCALDACNRVALMLGEPLEVTMLTRKNPLETAPFVTKTQPTRQRGKAVAPAGESGSLQAGDAVVAFSRKDVLTLSARYRQSGWSVATIYGALAPEVRRTEALRFANGEADIVVATDAIGMGLNLPIRRVVFSTVQKFDGESVRDLLPTELQQIAGRAGRYGLHDKGTVTTLDPHELEFVKKTLGTKLQDFKGKLAIAPNLWHIEALATMLGTKHIGTLLAYFADQVSTDSPLFTTASLEDSIALGHKVDFLIEQAGAELSLAHKFTLACAPIDAGKNAEMDFYAKCVWSILANREQKLPQPPEWLAKHNYSMLEAAEQLSKDISLYAWLSFKFPKVFIEGEQVSDLRSQVSAYIENALVQQVGFGETGKESRTKRGKKQTPALAAEGKTKPWRGKVKR